MNMVTNGDVSTNADTNATMDVNRRTAPVSVFGLPSTRRDAASTLPFSSRHFTTMNIAATDITVDEEKP